MGECGITLCSPEDKQNAVNRKMNNPVYGRIEINVIMLTLVTLTFQRLCIPVKKTKLNFAAD